MLNRFGSHFRHNVVAYVALGGTAIAAKPLLTGADVQDGSLTGADVSDNSTLKGVDIDESDLGQVPSAANADNAANADKLDGLDASELGGVTSFVETVGLTSAPVPLITLENGLILEASCLEGANFGARPHLRLRSEAGGLEPFQVIGNVHYFHVPAPNDEEDLNFVNRSGSPLDIGLDDGFVMQMSARDFPEPDPPGPWAQIDLEAGNGDAFGGGGATNCTFSGMITYPQ